MPKSPSLAITAGKSGVTIFCLRRPQPTRQAARQVTRRQDSSFAGFRVNPPIPAGFSGLLGLRSLPLCFPDLAASVKEIWGIGARTTEKLKQLNIHTAWDLAMQPSKRIQAEFSVVVARTVLELNGVACLELEEIAPDKQQIICSRSFSRKLTDCGELSRALAEYATRATEKLRAQQSVTGCITVFIRTNGFAMQDPQYQRTASLKLGAATQDTRIVISTANRLLQEIFKPGYAYHKCGVQLSQIQPANSPGQLDLFDLAGNGLLQESRQLMQVMDQINQRFPHGVSIAASGLDQSWKAKVERLSQAYTTNWQELVCVK
jgi:DNA polymerase V